MPGTAGVEVVLGRGVVGRGEVVRLVVVGLVAVLVVDRAVVRDVDGLVADDGETEEVDAEDKVEPIADGGEADPQAAAPTSVATARPAAQPPDVRTVATSLAPHPL